MKRICVSAGLVALSAAAARPVPTWLVQHGINQTMGPDRHHSRFYDDNYLTLPKTVVIGTSPGGHPSIRAGSAGGSVQVESLDQLQSFQF